MLAVIISALLALAGNRQEGGMPQRSPQQAVQPIPREEAPQKEVKAVESQRETFEKTPSMSRIERVQEEKVPKSQRATHPEIKEEVKRFLTKSKNHRQSAAAEKKNFKSSLPVRLESNRQAAKQVRSRINHYRPDFATTFNDHFFERHHYHPSYYSAGIDWWTSYPWDVINGWLGAGWLYPNYFDDSGYPVEVEPEASSTATAEDVEGDWLTLGVFVAARNVDAASFSPMFVQLAIDKEGDLAGTYYNVSTDEVNELDGTIDPDTQQAVWKVSDNPDSPIMTTGLYNLTQDVATVLVHFPDGTQQPWVLVRLRR